MRSCGRELLLVWITVVCLVLLAVALDVGRNVKNTHVYVFESSNEHQPHLTGIPSMAEKHRTLQESSVVVGNVTSFVLINTDTNLPIRVLLNKTVINLAAINTLNLTIQAIVSAGTLSPTSDIDYIQFGFDNETKAGTERKAPYSLCGNVKSQLLPCSKLTIGSHTISAIPYYSGQAGIGKSVAFDIVNVTSARITKSCKIPRVRLSSG